MLSDKENLRLTEHFLRKTILLWRSTVEAIVSFLVVEILTEANQSYIS